MPSSCCQTKLSKADKNVISCFSVSVGTHHIEIIDKLSFNCDINRSKRTSSPFILKTRSLGALQAPTSSLWPFGPPFGPSGLLDFVLRSLRALRPCDPRTVALGTDVFFVFFLYFLDFLEFSNPQKWISSEILMIFLFFTSKIRHL